jgi:glycosyltransferase involved in cell wall biosynthesis
MTPEVSVLLPYRNVASTVEEALDGLLGSAGPEIEVLAVDDGSTDDGPSVVSRLAARHRRVVPLSSGGAGLVAALRQAVSRATAPEFLARMDGDDVALPGRLAAQVARMREQPRLGALGTRVEPFPADAVGEGLRLYVDWQNSLLSPEEHARELFVESPLCHPSVLLRRRALDEVGGFREVPWAEDYDLWLRLDAAAWQLAKLPDLLLRWRHRPGRTTFADPRYALGRYREAKAPFLARRLAELAGGRPLALWGAGGTGRRLARALEPFGLRPAFFVDVDPRKIGGVARGMPIEPPDRLDREKVFVLAAVGVRGARALIRARIAGRGFREGEDFLFGA